MGEREQFELAHITNRLLSSRNRPKRQYFIERIGHMWSPPYRSCIIRTSFVDHVHAEPTHDSIAAVASFESDCLLNVRIAVTFALRQKSVPLNYSVPALSRLLTDSHPFVRINAAHSLAHSVLSVIDPHILSKALSDDAWTVRWQIAELLATTDLSDRGWSVLYSSCPQSNTSLLYWLQHCMPYADRFVSDHQLVTSIRDRIQSTDLNDYITRSNAAALQRLLERGSAA